MPIIVQYNADLQQRADIGGGPVADTRAAREVGETISEFGVTAAKFGGAVYEQQRALDRTRDQIEESRFKNYVKDADEETSNNAYANSKEDGSDLLANYDKDYQKRVGLALKEIKDPVKAQKYQAEAERVRVSRRGQLFVDQRKMQKQWSEKAFMGERNKMTANVYKNPYKAEKEWAQWSGMIESSAMTPEAKTNAIREGRKEVARSAISGHMAAEDFDGAKEALLSKYSDSFTAEEQIKMAEDIDGKKLKALEVSYRDEDSAFNRAKIQRTQSQEKIFKEKLSVINQLHTADATEADGQVRAIEDDIDREVSAGTLRSDRAEILKGLLKKEQTEDKAEVATDFYTRLVMRDDLSDLKEDVSRAAAEKQISSRTALEMFNQIDVMQTEKTKRTPLTKNDPRESAAIARIKGIIPKTNFGLPRTPEDSEREYQMLRQYHENLSSPKYKDDPDGASAAAIKKYSKDYKVSTTFGVTKTDTPKDISNRASKLFKEGKVSKEQYRDILYMIKARQIEEQDVKARKDGVK